MDMHASPFDAAEAELEAGAGTELLVVSRSATLRRSFAAAVAKQEVRCREARDGFHAIAIFAIGFCLRQIVFLGERAMSDARTVQRRLGSLGIPVVPMVVITDRDASDLTTIPVALMSEAATAVCAQMPDFEWMIPARDDEECERQLDARRELNKAQALLLNVVKRVESEDLPGPMMPQLLLKLRQKLRDPHLSLADLSDFVRPHQALSARVMALANSPHYCRAVPAASLRQALPRIGLERAGALLQAVATLEYEVGSDARTRALLRRLLKESYLTAMFAEHLAVRSRHPQAAEAYTIGLFHNIGPTFLVYTYALLFEQGAVKGIAPNALDQIALENRGQLNGLLVRELDLPDCLGTLDSATIGPSKSLERLVIQAGWMAERALDSNMDPFELDVDARMLGLDEPMIDETNRALLDIGESLAAFR